MKTYLIYIETPALEIIKEKVEADFAQQAIEQVKSKYSFGYKVTDCTIWY